MALIKCPECGIDVSDKADKCPKCGYPLIEKKDDLQVKNNTKPDVIVKSKEGCFLQTLNFGCAMIGLIIFIII